MTHQSAHQVVARSVRREAQAVCLAATIPAAVGSVLSVFRGQHELWIIGITAAIFVVVLLSTLHDRPVDPLPSLTALESNVGLGVGVVGLVAPSVLIELIGSYSWHPIVPIAGGYSIGLLVQQAVRLRRARKTERRLDASLLQPLRSPATRASDRPRAFAARIDEMAALPIARVSIAVATRQLALVLFLVVFACVPTFR
jgi:hypothetical protein